jgi:nascent polypeptide-associated complex subunit alpha
MLPKINPKQMEKMMKQLGMKVEEIDAERVVIEGKDKNIIIENPQISKIDMKGQQSFQIQGEAREFPSNEKGREETKEKLSEEDVKMVMDQTGCSEEEARKTLEETGDLAEAILKLKH